MKQEPLLPGFSDDIEREVRSARLQLVWPPTLKRWAQEYARQNDRSLNELTIEAMRLLAAAKEANAA